MAQNSRNKRGAVRKKKVKRNITKGVAHIHSTFNNTIVTIADEAGNVISWSSAGALGYKVPVNLHLMLHSYVQKQPQSLQLCRV